MFFNNKKISKSQEVLSDIYSEVSDKDNDLINKIMGYMLSGNETEELKMKKINDAIMKLYDIKYSTIVAFDGTQYVIKATNVDDRFWYTIRNLHNDPIFKECILEKKPKYITVDKNTESLPYQKIDFTRAKSAYFLPLYEENILIGYWFIESGEKHAFNNLDKNILEAIGENLRIVLKASEYRNVINNNIRTDKFTGLNTVEFLYGQGKQYIDKYQISTACMLKIINLNEINEKFNRSVGNQIITKASECIKNKLEKGYIGIRYTGPKIAIVFLAVEPDKIKDNVRDLKNEIENIKISSELDESNESKIYASPKLNIVVTPYYKGTSMSEVLKKMEEYLDNADSNQSEVNDL